MRLNQPMHHYPNEPLPAFAAAAKNTEMHKQAHKARQPFDQFMANDGADVDQFIDITMRKLLDDTKNPDGSYNELLFRKHWKTRKHDINEVRSGWRTEDPVQISDHHRRKIARLWSECNEYFPTRPDLASAAAWRKAKKQGHRFWEVWKLHHADWASLDAPLAHDPDATVADTVPSPHPWGQFDQQSMDMDEAFRVNGLTDVHRLIAGYMIEDPKMSGAEIHRRLTRDDGIKIGRTTVSYRIKDIRKALTTWLDRKDDSERGGPSAQG